MRHYVCPIRSLCLLQLMKSPHNHDIAPSTRRPNSVCLLHQRLDREQNQAELFSLSPDATKLKMNPEALFQRQAVPAKEHCSSPGPELPSSGPPSGPSPTSPGPVLDWIYGYQAVPTQSNPLPGKTARAQKLTAMTAENSMKFPLAWCSACRSCKRF